MAEVSKAAAKIAEVAADGVADGLHIVGEEALAAEAVIQGIAKVRLEFMVIGIAAGTAIGAIAGYRIAVKRLEARYEELMEEEGQRLQEHYSRREAALRERQEKPAVEQLGQVVERLGYDGPGGVVPPPVPRPEPEAPIVEEPRDVPPPAPAIHSVFGADLPEWDAEKEVAARTPEVPYVITVAEYRLNESDFEQMTWTYYAGDDVLTNEGDSEVDQDDTVGVANIARFGHGSGDPNVVYVRNVEKGFEVEIIRSSGTFAHEVQGLDEHNIRHSDDHSMRRRHKRFDDE